MIFNSLAYLIFFPIVITCYFLMPFKFRWAFLLAASYYFYMSWKIDLIYLILLTTVISYICAILIEKTENIKRKRIFLTIALISSLGVLFFFKYFNFLSVAFSNFLNSFGMGLPEYTLNLILPIGISFYTFQTLSYVIDVYRGKVKTERHFGYFALYVSFFPALVAGPIERPESLLPQLKIEHKPDKTEFTEGLRIIIRGFFKKLAIADLTAGYVNTVFNNPAEATGLTVIVASLLFAVQIYCDFSGYTDIAIGCARMMGIKLTQNFNLPYSAKSIREFWSHWHISLSTWFRDYLYIPLGGNRCAVPRRLTNIFIVFLVSGLWHGAEWTFIIWGALHGLYQIIGYLTRNIREKLYNRFRINKTGKAAGIWQNICTFILVLFAWIFFRANNVSELGILLNRLLFSWTDSLNSISSIGYGAVQIAITLLSVYIMRILDRSPGVLSSNQNNGKLNFLLVNKYALAVWIIAVAWLILLTGDGAGEFIYFQF